MKVGIMTFPNSVSYGASLQTLALQKVVSEMGHQVEVINYHNPYMKAEKHVKRKGHPLKGALKKAMGRCLHQPLYTRFRRFEKQVLCRYPDKPFTDKRRLVEVGRRYDAVICGSDQVWNPEITNADLSYFLDFCGNDTRRISYAPSFGFESFSDAFYEEIAPELDRFSALSVREQPGKQLVDTLTGLDSTIVVDPTFLVERSQWAAMEKPHPLGEGDYVLYFVVRHSEELMRRCVAFAKEKGLRVVVVGGNPLKKKTGTDPLVEHAVDIGPDEWLYLVHHAKYVFTNSFHGTAFSILFQKELYVEYPAQTGSRLRQVLEFLGLEDRVVREGEPLCEQPTRYDKAEEPFIQMREQSMRFLQDALAE